MVSLCFPFWFLLSSECLKVTIWRNVRGISIIFGGKVVPLKMMESLTNVVQKPKIVIVFDSTLIKKDNKTHMKICCSIHHGNKQT